MPAQCSGDAGGKEPTEAHTAATHLGRSDQPAPGPGSWGAAPESPGGATLRDSAQGCPCPPAQASSARPRPCNPEKPGPEAWVPPGASAGDLRPQPPGPSLQHPAQPPSMASEGPGQEREGPPPAPCSARPASPGVSPVQERDGQAPGSRPERPRAADCRPCPSGVDARPLPRTACASLQEATRLIQEEFAFDGYLDNGLEALIMGTGGHGAAGDSGPARGPHTSASARRRAAPGSNGVSEPSHPLPQLQEQPSVCGAGGRTRPPTC